MRTYTLNSQPKPVKFTGMHLAHASTETDSALRWLELDLYKIEDGPNKGQYLLHRTGQSLVFHKSGTNGGCGYGKAVKWHDVPDDAEPCPACKPEKSPDGSYEIWLEVPRYRVVRCPTPEAVEDALLQKGRDGGKFLSGPAASLLDEAVNADPELAAWFEEAESLLVYT